LWYTCICDINGFTLYMYMWDT